ncbi:S-layer homology domain-containing protein [Brevibacillus laterosporus]|uniref:S-layer homology domain-containing protein n=1 Tax=Brevibacillus laterosporus TaxID=1465 RepID=A0AAP3GCG0_BRELA|nr:S-layer homology domain-containing protein [Brevibacillus laterosporus]MCR8982441.1 S-layer homology domain-containing protein [Brevibacillus laterosporus]MCZ0809597.1 S-layer homology domain-containing protein [Brevibacillus laterosporus]MCZ0828130.1 S-layer homology domain-containing protein [Brevibacillus laterosporus]MCZ0852152.1 S-layer homology domain-containing protein [Brevibacillus laterosporus]
MKPITKMVLSLSIFSVLASGVLPPAYAADKKEKETVTIPNSKNEYEIVDIDGNKLHVEIKRGDDEIKLVLTKPTPKDPNHEKQIIRIPVKKTGGGSSGGGGKDSKDRDRDKDRDRGNSGKNRLPGTTVVTTPSNPNAGMPIPPDAVNHWALNDMLTLQRLGLLKGYPDGTIKPDKTITRAEYAALLERVLKMAATVPQPGQSSGFTDVRNVDWFFNPVSSLVSRKNINPGYYPKNALLPSTSITREEIALWTAVDVPTSNQTVSFTDENKLKHPGEVKKVASVGLLVGYPDGSYRPIGNTTRAEAASLMVRFLRLKGVIK